MHVILMKMIVGFTSASTHLTLTVLRAPLIVVRRSFRLSFTSVKFLPTTAEHTTIRSRCCRELHYWPAGPCAGLTYSCECDNSCHVSVSNFVCALRCSFFLLFVCFDNLFMLMHTESSHLYKLTYTIYVHTCRQNMKQYTPS